MRLVPQARFPLPLLFFFFPALSFDSVLAYLGCIRPHSIYMVCPAMVEWGPAYSFGWKKGHDQHGNEKLWHWLIGLRNLCGQSRQGKTCDTNVLKKKWNKKKKNLNKLMTTEILCVSFKDIFSSDFILLIEACLLCPHCPCCLRGFYRRLTKTYRF